MLSGYESTLGLVRPEEFAGWRNRLHALDDDMVCRMNAAADKKQARYRAKIAANEWEDVD